MLHMQDYRPTYHHSQPSAPPMSPPASRLAEIDTEMEGGGLQSSLAGAHGHWPSQFMPASGHQPTKTH